MTRWMADRLADLAMGYAADWVAAAQRL